MIEKRVSFISGIKNSSCFDGKKHGFIIKKLSVFVGENYFLKFEFSRSLNI